MNECWLLSLKLALCQLCPAVTLGSLRLRRDTGALSVSASARRQTAPCQTVPVICLFCFPWSWSGCRWEGETHGTGREGIEDWHRDRRPQGAAMEQLETYQPLSWAHMVHGLPHLNLHLQAVGSAFLPRDWEYQQALIFLAGLVMLTLAINLTFLLIYLLHLCYCSPGGRGESQMRDPKRRTSQSVAAVLLCW
ncbi:protein tweety homolog 1-like [Stegostoma tigrinum]|uniref:protein tweety homolog 1-like n=1 Tax=Stegostoma tigrinum TaxID=3053191 RepID=UPI0028700708|nr:protein tweety homolog 1-like [Stegostoma tigrinum]